MDANKLPQVVKLLQEIDEYKKTHKLEFYAPYEFQKKFHHAKGTGEFVPVASDKKKEGLALFRSLMCANQIGKCNSISTLIETDQGRKRLRDIWGKDNVMVLTWPNNEPRRVTKWIRKPAEECFRVVMSDGQWFESPKGHRIMTSDGYVSLGEVFSSMPSSVVHARGFLQNVRANARRWMGTVRGLWNRYLVDFRLSGGRLLYDQENVQVFSPSLDDVRQRNGHLYSLGDLVRKCTDNLCEWLLRLSSPGDAHLISGQCAYEASQVHVFGCPRYVDDSLGFWQFLGLAHLGNGVSSTTTHQSFSRSIPSVCGNEIVSVYSVGAHTLYDMEVEERHNYIAGGIVHHNSTGGGMETAMHLTGIYPPWWEGHRFDHPIEALCSSTTNETTKDRCQTELMGDPADDDAKGTGAIPKYCIGQETRRPGVPNALESVMVKHFTNGSFDGWSKCYFKSYDQGPKKFMGYRLDVFWDDEEPPPDILAQQDRATIATNGIGYITFTPEEGITEVVHDVMHNPRVGSALLTATWDDAPHMTQELRAQTLAKFRPHEREMRSKGIPMVGTGLVWPVTQDQISVEPFEIPRHFARVFGFDIGWDHPSALACIAVDRDKDKVYVYDVYKVSKAVIPIIASAIKQRGAWIPVMWPHDGMKNDPRSGKPIADLYRHEGINMHRECFTNPPAPGQKEGQGGNGVEVGLLEILTMMETGRFKVFSHCKEWFDEWRMYHRKDGQVVKLMDDLMSATRYAVMMRRHAMTEPVRTRPKLSVVGVSNW